MVDDVYGALHGTFITFGGSSRASALKREGDSGEARGALAVCLPVQHLYSALPLKC